MCTVGDIILVKSYQHKEHTLSRHSFVVLSVEAATIQHTVITKILNSQTHETG